MLISGWAVVIEVQNPSCPAGAGCCGATFKWRINSLQGGYLIHYQVNTSLSWALQTLNNASRACPAYRKHLFSHSSLAQSYYNLSHRNLHSHTHPGSHRETEVWLQVQTVTAAAWCPALPACEIKKYNLHEKEKKFWSRFIYYLRNWNKLF